MTTTASVALDAPPAAPGTARRLVRPLGLLVAVALLGLVVLLSIGVGARTIGLGTVLDALTSSGGGDDATVVRTLRVPRTVLGLAVGAALGAAGVLMQGLTRNPVADPGILGLSSGAALAAVLGFRFGLDAPWQTAVLAVLGAAAAGAVVYVLGTRGRASATPASLALAGVAMSFLLLGLVRAVVLLDATTLDQYRFWEVGALAGRDLSLLTGAAPLLVVGAVLAVVVVRPLDLLALGDDVARGLGTNVTRARLLTALATVLLVGSATALCGPIVFVGLVVPHVARAFTGPDTRWVLAWSVVLGPLLLLASDVLGRVVNRPGELQVGVVTALVGAPVLVLLVRRTRLPAL